MLLLLACNIGSPGINGHFGDDEVYALTLGAEETDEAWGVAALADGGAIVGTHQSAPNPTADAYIYRIDAAGTVVWSAMWGGESTEKVFPVTVTSDRVYVGGTTYTGLGNDTADGFVLAFDLETGEEIWSWTTGLEGYEEIDDIVAYDGHLYISGWSTSNDNDALVGSLTTNGALEWLSPYDSGGWDEANGGMYVGEEGVFVTGIREGAGYMVGGTGMLAAWELDGTFRWTQDIPGCDSYCDGLGLTSDGDRLYTVGMALDGLTTEMDLHAFDLEGNVQWSGRYNGLGVAYGRAIEIQNGTLRVAGTTAGDQDDVVVLDLSPTTGEVLDAVTWAGAANDQAHEISIGEDVMWVAGETESLGAGKSDGLLLRLPLDLGRMPPTE